VVGLIRPSLPVVGYARLCGGTARGMQHSVIGIPRRERAQRQARPLWVWPALSAVVVGAVIELVAITVTTLIFSLTVVALQLASQQFSPRLLREFTRDPVTRVVLSVLAATFLGCLIVLRHLHERQPPPVPAALVVLLLGLFSFAAVLGFITHIVRILRVDSMMKEVHEETSRAIKRFYPPHGEDAASPSAADTPSSPGTVVHVEVSGFVRMVDNEALVAAAREADGVVRVDARPGDHVVDGVPIAVVWADDPADLVEATRPAVVVEFERTLEQDAAYSFRQLEDIAVRALSPSVNDPVTAAHAVGHMSDLLVRLAWRRLGPSSHPDEDGTVRAIIPDRDFRYYLDLATGELRRYAAGEPTVLVGLLRMLRDVAVAARDEHQRAEIERQVELVLETTSDRLLPRDVEPVRDMARRVRLALAGEELKAYLDRSRETRSI
jgi:uncharacterized membrane protein